MDGVEVSVMGWVINSCQCQPMHSSHMCEEQSHVYQSRCVLAISINFLVFACPARFGHCSRHSESGMTLRILRVVSQITNGLLPVLLEDEPHLSLFP